MQQWTDVPIDPDGNVVDGATVTVRDSTGTIAAIYSDNGTTSKSNPFVTGTDTSFGFYAPNGTYTVTIQKSGYTPVTHTGVVLYDQTDDTLETAATIIFDDAETYPDGTIGDAIAALNTLAHTVEGTTNQVTVTEVGDTLTWSLPTAIVAPGSLVVTDQLSGKGTGTNDSATAGQIGEYVESVIPSASAVSLTTVTGANVTTLSLTAGDWEVWGNLGFTGTATAVTYGGGAMNTTSATLPAAEYRMNWLGRGAAMPVDPVMVIPRRRLSIASTTTVYLVAQASFSGGTCSSFGFIAARRMR